MYTVWTPITLPSPTVTSRGEEKGREREREGKEKGETGSEATN